MALIIVLVLHKRHKMGENTEFQKSGSTSPELHLCFLYFQRVYYALLVEEYNSGNNRNIGRETGGAVADSDFPGDTNARGSANYYLA